MKPTTTPLIGRLVAVVSTIAILRTAGVAQPHPGDVFREYRWTNVGGDAGGSLRVGGRVGYGGGPVFLPHRFDLEHAIKAEVVIEKLLCHEATRGLEVSLNNQAWLAVPEAPGLPDPPWDYQHHTYPVVAVPLEYLNAEAQPQFRMRVSSEHPWNWPQHLIYGVHVRVYYDADRKPHPNGRVVSPRPNAALGREILLKAEAGSPNGAIRELVFLGHHEDVNWEGDGRYTQWHYHYVQAKLTGQLATATAAPWQATWDTSWVPDQPAPFEVAAWITDETGLTRFTEPVGGLRLQRDGLSVELCKPYDVPAKWVTRAGEKSENFRVAGNLDHAVAAQIVWVSWSPGYMHGISINGREVFDREGPRYAYYAHRVPLKDLSVLRAGENTLTTALTPKYDGKMVHGMEVNWPGIMVLIQYQVPPASAAATKPPQDRQLALDRGPLTTTHDGDIPASEWIVFVGPAQPRRLFVRHQQDDPLPDRLYQMQQKMTVFGFGRSGLTKYLDHVPQGFSIGFLKTGDPAAIHAALSRQNR